MVASLFFSGVHWTHPEHRNGLSSGDDPLIHPFSFHFVNAFVERYLIPSAPEVPFVDHRAIRIPRRVIS